MTSRSGFALLFVQVAVVSLLLIGLTVGPGMYVDWFTSTTTRSEMLETRDLNTEIHEVSVARRHLGLFVDQPGKGQAAQEERAFLDEAVRNYNTDAAGCDDTVFEKSGLPLYLPDTRVGDNAYSTDLPE